MQRLWTRVRGAAKTFGDFQARLILTLFYLILIVPTAVLARIGGPHLPRSRAGTGSFWHARAYGDQTLRGARRQG